MRLSQQNVSYSRDEEELDIRSPSLVPLITYPHFSESEYNDRISEMESIGITSIILGGKTIVNGAPIAGKGCVGIVVKSKVEGKICALKIRRTDADRKTMNEEAHFHKLANSIGVGPHLEGQTTNLIVMEYIAGQSIIDWIVDNTNKNNKSAMSKMRTITKSILEQCFSLDAVGLDHGELSRLARHVIVSGSPHIIDFESASTIRKTSNVTAAAQSIFLYGIMADRVKKNLDNFDKDKVVLALRTYKHLQTRANFDKVLNLLPI